MKRQTYENDNDIVEHLIEERKRLQGKWDTIQNGIKKSTPSELLIKSYLRIEKSASLIGACLWVALMFTLLCKMISMDEDFWCFVCGVIAAAIICIPSYKLCVKLLKRRILCAIDKEFKIDAFIVSMRKAEKLSDEITELFGALNEDSPKHISENIKSHISEVIYLNESLWYETFSDYDAISLVDASSEEQVIFLKEFFQNMHYDKNPIAFCEYKIEAMSNEIDCIDKMVRAKDINKIIPELASL